MDGNVTAMTELKLSSRPKPSRRPLRGIALMIAASLIVPNVDGIAKYLTADHSVFFVSWARYAAASAFVLPVAAARLGGNLFPKGDLSAHALRTFFIVAAMTCFFFALREIPLATAFGGYFIGPVIASVLAVLLLKERMTIGRWIAVLIGFIGALFIVKPGIQFQFGSLLALASGGLFACYLIATRRAAQEDSPLITLVFQCVFGTLLLTPLAALNWSWPSTETILLIGAMGLLSALSHWLAISAFRYAEVSVLSPLAYFELVTATVIGFVVFSEFPEISSWLGTALIVVGGLLVGLGPIQDTLNRSRKTIRS